MNTIGVHVVCLACLIPTFVVGFDLPSLRSATDEYLASAEGRQTADNILSWQNANGGWWKNYDYAVRGDSTTKKRDPKSGFDNGATWTELRFLANAYRVTKETKYRDAVNRGVEFIFQAQYANGGWPQHIPTGNRYERHITYNDDAMSNVMFLLLDISEGRAGFEFIEKDVRERAKKSFDLGVECILKTQIRVNGKLTGWCAQHDEITFAPATARSYELPSISGSEGSVITKLLMRIENPDDRVKRAVHASAAWFEASKMTGKALIKRPMDDDPTKNDTYLVDDPAGEPLWARFYDIETNRPFYCDRDGVKKGSMAEIGHERRNGYAWIRPFGKKVLDAYPKWVEKNGPASAIADDPAQGTVYNSDATTAGATTAATKKD